MYEHDIVYLQDNLLRMKPTKWISERFHLMSSPRSACISPTRSVTPTAPQKYPNSPSRRRSHWNYSWLLTFWIAKVAKIMERKLKTFLVVFFFFFFWVFNLFCYSLHMKNNPFSVVCCCFISIKRWHFNMLNGYSRMWQMCPPPPEISPHHTILIKTYLVSTLFPVFGTLCLMKWSTISTMNMLPIFIFFWSLKKRYLR